MSQTRDLLVALARQRFSASCRARVEALSQGVPVDWESVLALAAAEGVAPIVGVNLAACDAGTTKVPAVVTARFQRALFENVAVKIQRHRQLVEGLAHFDLRGYDVLLLKSAALEASGVYAQAWVTCARDIDLVLRRRDGAVVAPDEWAVRALSRDQGIECEIHGHHDVSMYGLVAVSFNDIWRDAHSIACDDAGTRAFVMCPEDALFTLCVNACRQSYFRLKVLFDIVETVEHYSRFDWTAFAARACAADACGLVFTALCAADETIGLPAPARRCYSQLLPPRRAALLRALVRGLRGSSSRPRLGLLALRYASLSGQQRWASARRGAMQWPSRQLTSRDLSAGALPGE